MAAEAAPTMERVSVEQEVVAPPKPARRRRPLVIGLVLAAFALAGGYWWVSHRGLESTDDAQIDVDVVAVPSRATGTVLAIHFTDNQTVAAGALLVELDAATAQTKLAQAEAELVAAQASADAADATAQLTEANAKAGKDVAKASLTGATIAVAATGNQIAEAKASLSAAKTAHEKASQDLERAKQLVASGSMPGTMLDAAQATFDTTAANVKQAEAHVATLQSSTSQAQAKVGEAAAKFGQADTIDAQLAESKAKAAAARARVATASATRDLARLDLSYTKIYAPHAGIVSKRAVSVGQLVTAGQTVVMVVPTEAVWVTGNFKETQITKMHVGQPATFGIDAYGGLELHGTVESFSGATGARFALLPPDNATGNFTKVVQRVPVRIKITDLPKDLVLLPGLSVELTVDTRR
jgi:membrane fusion protein (multidrug efflux system)